MGTGIDYIPERDRELYAAYKKALARKDVKSHKEAIQVAVKSTASRFWISTLQAYRGILLLRKGVVRTGTRSIRDKMINDIYKIYQKLECKREFRDNSVFFITSFAVNQEAPEFYISFSRALAIIQRFNKEKRHGR